MSNWDRYNYTGTDGDTYNSVLNNQQGSGGYTTTGDLIYGVAAQAFDVVCTGLKPNTLHSAYLVNKLVNADCAPSYNWSPGVPLITDGNGYLHFTYYFKPENSPYEVQQYGRGDYAEGTIAIIPAGNQRFYVTSADGNSYAHNFILQK